MTVDKKLNKIESLTGPQVSKVVSNLISKMGYIGVEKTKII